MVDAIHKFRNLILLSGIFFFGREKRKFLFFKSTQRKQHSGAAALYTNEDLSLEEKSFMVLESK